VLDRASVSVSKGALSILSSRFAVALTKPSALQRWTSGRVFFTFREVANNAKSAAQSPGESIAFEDALKKLEKIVDDMEAGELPLETLLSRFEEGSKLVKVCQAKLDEAELKIQKLEKNAAGEITLKPLQPSATED
jgi:exodeoxyribonuclease VII small subunit